MSFMIKFDYFQADKSGKYLNLIGVPKALLPARPGHSQETILDCWWNVVKRYSLLRLQVVELLSIVSMLDLEL